MLTEYQVHTPDLTILISCKKDIAKPRYIKRKRGDDDEKLFDQRYADYERRDMKVVDLYRRSLVQVGALKLIRGFPTNDRKIRSTRVKGCIFISRTMIYLRRCEVTRSSEINACCQLDPSSSQWNFVHWKRINNVCFYFSTGRSS